jgi:FkbM family methyltransferase
MNFSAIPYRSLLGKVLRFPLRFIPSNMKMPILQGRLRGKRWITGSSNHGCWLGSYEYEKRILFEKTVKEGDIVFDIGAHVGFYTLLAAVLVGHRGRVFAFEPLARNLLYLREHLRLNRITNVTVFEAAVSDFTGTAFFNEGKGSSRGRISAKGKLKVKTVSLDELVSQGEVPLPQHIKIDVEGSEMLVLSGAKSILANAYITLFLATHGPDVHRKCCEFLRSLGYYLQPIIGDGVEETDEILAYRKGG